MVILVVFFVDFFFIFSTPALTIYHVCLFVCSCFLLFFWVLVTFRDILVFCLVRFFFLSSRLIRDFVLPQLEPTLYCHFDALFSVGDVSEFVQITEKE